MRTHTHMCLPVRLGGEVVQHGDAERRVEGPVPEGHLGVFCLVWLGGMAGLFWLYGNHLIQRSMDVMWVSRLVYGRAGPHAVSLLPLPFTHTHTCTHLQHVAGKHLHSRGLLPPPIPTFFPIPLSLLLLRPPLPLPFLLLLRRPRRARQQADGAVAAEGERGGVEGVPSQLQVLAVPTPDVG